MGAEGARAAFNKWTNVSRETMERFKDYESLVRKWNPAINLVAKSTLDTIWTRHMLDSAQIWRLRPKGATTWVDIGSGGGFPGLVIAILAADEMPNLRITLIESDQRKAAFLLSASQKLGISPVIHVKRAEDVQRQGADVVTARALAPLTGLLCHSERHLSHTGTSVFPKGKNSNIELTEAKKYWTFDTQQDQSITDPDGVILSISGLRRIQSV